MCFFLLLLLLLLSPHGFCHPIQRSAALSNPPLFFPALLLFFFFLFYKPMLVVLNIPPALQPQFTLQEELCGGCSCVFKFLNKNSVTEPFFKFFFPKVGVSLNLKKFRSTIEETLALVIRRLRGRSVSWLGANLGIIRATSLRSNCRCDWTRCWLK